MAHVPVAGAGLEVFEEEPVAADRPLCGFDQVVLTPHSAALIVACAERLAVGAVRNALDFSNDRLDPGLAVNRTRIG